MTSSDATEQDRVVAILTISKMVKTEQGAAKVSESGAINEIVQMISVGSGEVKVIARQTLLDLECVQENARYVLDAKSMILLL